MHLFTKIIDRWRIGGWFIIAVATRTCWAQWESIRQGRTTHRCCNALATCVQFEYIGMSSLTTRTTGVPRSLSPTSTTGWITHNGHWWLSIPISTMSPKSSVLITSLLFRINPSVSSFTNLSKVFTKLKAWTRIQHIADDTGMFYGMKYYNDLLMEAGPFGNVQSEVLLRKDPNTFTFKQGWAFPRKVYFNGDECMLPPPDSYPYLPNAATLRAQTTLPSFLISAFLLALMVMW